MRYKIALLKTDEGYSVVNVEAPEMMAALERGNIDAYAVWEPRVTRGRPTSSGDMLGLSTLPLCRILAHMDDRERDDDIGLHTEVRHREGNGEGTTRPVWMPPIVCEPLPGKTQMRLRHWKITGSR